MNKDQILNTSAMPAIGPSYAKGPYRFINREYLIIIYESDPEAIRAALPEPLEPLAEPQVYYEFIKMPDSDRNFGDYTESGIVIPCQFEGQRCNFTCQMYLNDHPPIAGGREVWGFPKKYAQPSLEVKADTLTGKLYYAEELVALGTMAYKEESLASQSETIVKALSTTQINLKLIPDVDGKPAIAQLVGYNMTDITLKGAWAGRARIHLIPHANAPVADLPVRRVIGGRHYLADITLPYGRVLHDYLK